MARRYTPAEQFGRLVRVRLLCDGGGRECEARKIRRRAGDISAEAVAEVVGVSPATIRNWESGHTRPNGQAALRYLDLLQELERATEEARNGSGRDDRPEPAAAGP